LNREIGFLSIKLTISIDVVFIFEFYNLFCIGKI